MMFPNFVIFLLYTCTRETKKEVSKSIRTVWFKTLKIIFAQPMLQYTNTCNQEKFYNAPSQMRTTMRTQIRILDASIESNSFFTKDFTDITSYEPSCSLAPSTYLHHVLNASFAFRIAFHLF